MANKIAVAGLINFMGTFLVKGIAFLSVPVFTRLLSVGEYGLVSTYASYISFLLVVVGLSLSSAIQNARFDYKKRFSEFNYSVSIASLAVFLVEVAALNLLHVFISDFLNISWGDMNIVLLIAFSQYTLSAFMKINAVDFNYRVNVLLSLLNVVCNLVFSILLIYLMPDHVTARLLGQLAFLLVAAICIYVALAKRAKLKWSLSDVRYALGFAVPNMFHQVSMVIMNQFDRVAILRFSGEAAAGLYSVAFNFEMIVQMVFSAANDVWVPWLYRKLKAGEVDSTRSWTKVYVSLFSLGVIVLMMTSPELMVLLAPDSYFAAKKVVAPLVLGAYFVFIYSFFVNLEIYHKKNRYLAIGTVIAAILNVMGNIVFVPIFGYTAAAYTTFAAYVFLSIFHAIIVSVILKISIYKLRLFLPWVTLVLLAGVTLQMTIDAIVWRYGSLVLLAILWIAVVRLQRIDLMRTVRSVRAE